jgi:hypothetical protein
MGSLRIHCLYEKYSTLLFVEGSQRAAQMKIHTALPGVGAQAARAMATPDTGTVARTVPIVHKKWLSYGKNDIV